jgi:hypothetical protein
MNTSALIDTLHNFINQRPGLNPREYMRDNRDADGLAAYRSDARGITRDLHDARALLRYVELHPTIDAQRIIDAAGRGRLTIKPVYVQNSGLYGLPPEVAGYEIDYCTGQYWPTEYRAAVARVLSDAIWKYFREDCLKNQTGADAIRTLARKELTTPIARRWFN